MLKCIRKLIREEMTGTARIKDDVDDPKPPKVRYDTHALWADDLPQPPHTDASRGFSIKESDSGSATAEDRRDSNSDVTEPIKALKKKKPSKEGRDVRL